MRYNPQCQKLWNRGLVKISPSLSLSVIQHSALCHWRRAPRWSRQMIHHARRNSSKPRYSLTCSWFGLCLARIGEIRCTAGTQFYPLHRHCVSSSNRATSWGIFHGWSRGGKRQWNRLQFTVCPRAQGLMPPTPQSAWDVPQKPKKWGQKRCVLVL